MVLIENISIRSILLTFSNHIFKKYLFPHHKVGPSWDNKDYLKRRIPPREVSPRRPLYKLYEIWDILRKATVMLSSLNSGLKLGETPGRELKMGMHSAGLAQGTWQKAWLMNIKDINK